MSLPILPASMPIITLIISFHSRVTREKYQGLRERAVLEKSIAFNFSDTAAANWSQRFYRVTSP
ncbi:MAG TPA: hypothetical protein VNZ64_26330 [Candidatus Acidoferrum sp.]|nr:hypothetical protein [Candidatus Acidoferrum sp.]